MNNNQTIKKLREMRIKAMAELHLQHLKSNSMDSYTPDQYLGILADHEWENRQNQKIERLMKQAFFRQRASIEEVNLEPERNLERNMFNRLATLDFMKRKENIIITGASGTGKSYLAQALGHQACLEQQKTLYVNTARLLARLRLAKVDGTYLKELKKSFDIRRFWTTSLRQQRKRNLDGYYRRQTQWHIDSGSLTNTCISLV